MTTISNGNATYRVSTHRRDDEGSVLSTRAKITAKRVQANGTTFDRVTGRRVSAFFPGMKFRRLLGYQIDGENFSHCCRDN